MPLTLSGLGSVEIACRKGSGAISMPGLKAGDLVIYSAIGNAWQPPGSLFEAIVSADDELQQLDASDLTARSAWIVFHRLKG